MYTVLDLSLGWQKWPSLSPLKPGFGYCLGYFPFLHGLPLLHTSVFYLQQTGGITTARVCCMIGMVIYQRFDNLSGANVSFSFTAGCPVCSRGFLLRYHDAILTAVSEYFEQVELP